MATLSKVDIVYSRHLGYMTETYADSAESSQSNCGIEVKVPVFTLPFTLSTLLIVMGWNEQVHLRQHTGLTQGFSPSLVSIMTA